MEDVGDAGAAADDNEQMRQEELLAMGSIYGHDEVFCCDSDNMTGLITVGIEPERPLTVKPTDKDGVPVEVSCLPPVSVEFSLPAEYPSHAPPKIRVVSNWLTPLQMLKVWTHLTSLWERSAANCVLFEYAEFLKNDLLAFLGIDIELDVTFFVERFRNSSQKRLHALADTSSSRLRSADADIGGGTGDVIESVSDRSAYSFRKRDQPVTSQPSGVTRTCHQPDQRAPAASSVRRDGIDQLRDRYRLTLAADADIHHLLLAHQRHQRAVLFLRARFLCKICGDERAGSECVQLSACGHVYCRLCVSQYYTVLIGDGGGETLRCPEHGCTENATPHEVRDLVGAELFERYDRLLLSSSLVTMSDVAVCPRLHCQCMVLLELDDCMGRCPSCEYVFCSLCKRAYHGHNPCAIDNEERKALLKAYLSGTRSERDQLESRYGKRQLQNMLEESQSLQWISNNSVSCPKCNTHIEKIDGCNKMTCTKCGSLFCWLCKSALNRSTPYLHYNLPGQSCFNQLFAGVVVDPDDWTDDQQLALFPDDEDDFLPMGFLL